MKIAVYGKGGIGKSTVSSNVSVALAKRGKKVLQIGCDPKHDSTFSLTGFLIPTIIDTLASKNYHYEEIWVEDIIYQGFGSVHCVESGGPPAGSGCGGYVVGETVKLLKELNAFYEYDIILFDVLGDVVCGGFAAPLNYSDYCLIVVDNGFDSIYAANRILASIHEKAKSHQIRFIGLVANKTSTVDQHLIQHYFKLCPMPLLDVIPNLDSLRLSKIEGKTIFQLANFNDQHGASLQYFSNFYLNIADEFLSQPEGVLIQEAEDKKLFHFLSTVGVDDVELGSTQSNPPITSDTELVGQSSVTSRQHVADGNVELGSPSRQKQSQNDLVFI